MARLLRMPEVAANATEAVLSDWVVEENVDFGAGDTLASIETEKAVVDVEAETSGLVLKALVRAGAQVEVGAPIAVIGEPGETVEDLAGLLTELGIAETTEPVLPERRDVPATAPSEPDAARSVADDAPSEPDAARSVPDDAPGEPDGADPEGGTASTRPSAPSVVPAAVAQPRPTTGRIFTSPLARRLAKEAGLRLEEIDGTGPRKRVLRRDVERTVAARRSASTQPVTSPTVSAVESPAGSAVPAAGSPAGPAGLAVPASGSPTAAAAYEEVPHSRIRRATAARLIESKQTAPHFYVRATVRADALTTLRRELNDGADVAVSLNDLVVKAAAAAHVKVPEMNVVWTDDAVRRFEGVDVAVAVATELGLLTPVVRDVGRLSVTALATQVRGLVERARTGRLRQDDLEGGSLTVTNLGMYGTEEFAAIINPPHAAILAVGAVRQEPVVVDGALAVGQVMRLTLSVDHRPVDGVVAARWMQALVGLLEHPVRILA